MTLNPEILSDLSLIKAAEWNALSRGNPTLNYAYLEALHSSGSASADTGWQPQFLILRDSAGRLAAACPLYVKSHSYGEYVFDWAWANAYQRAGIEYYPKLLAALPFTPTTGGRLLARDATSLTELAQALVRLAKGSDLSSLHVLFPTAAERDALVALGLSARQGVQFHWHNRSTAQGGVYRHFEDFLMTLSHDKRKKIRQERRKVEAAGVSFTRKIGAAITETDWDFFYRCYSQTYREHGSTPYLTRDFFTRIAATMPSQLMLAIAHRADEPIAASFCLWGGPAGDQRIYGRYWGALATVPCLHFEACYYQTIEFAIEQQLAVFEGGAQGEHKLARGLIAVETTSCHWLAHPQFAKAVDDFLEREASGMTDYLADLTARQPFRREL